MNALFQQTGLVGSFRSVVLFLIVLQPFSPLYAESAEDRIEVLEKRLEHSLRLIDGLVEKIDRLEQANRISQTSVDMAAGHLGDQERGGHEMTPAVDLSEREYASIGDVKDSHGEDDRVRTGHVLSNPWWQNFSISGFAASGYYDTGSSGTREHGTFELKEASLFIEADIWEDAAFFLELQTNRLGKDDSLFARTGEVYVHFRELYRSENLSVAAKMGRIDIPFGEEYLIQDSSDNPLVTTSAVYPYGWDEGLLLYGEYRNVNWIVALTDGTDARSFEENSDKAVNLKLYGNVTDDFYLSASFMRNGEASKSAFEFGGSHFQPVGASRVSTLGTSPSAFVDSALYQVDLKYEVELFSKASYLSASIGAANQDDVGTRFDRDLRWFTLEPYLRFDDNWYLAARFSQIETADDSQGYHFDGKIYAGGNGDFGYDATEFQRLGVVIGYMPNPRLKVKLEVGRDWYELIDSSPFSGQLGNREFVGLEVVGGF